MAVNFEIETIEIKVGKGSLTVRGLDSEDVAFLTTNYLADLRTTVAKYATKGGKLQRTVVADLVTDVVKDFPLLTTEIISRCAEATSAEDVSKIRRMPFVKQLEALKAILNLSVEEGSFDLKKVVGAVASLLEANGINPGPLTESLQTIIGTSEAQSSS